MLSFTKIITLAAVAFGTLSQAVPLDPRGATPATVTPSTKSVQLSGILAEVKAKLVVELLPIVYLTHENATAANCSPILESVNVILSDAVKVVLDLTSCPINEVLAGVDGVLITVEAVFELVCAILVVVFEALQIVWELVADISELLSIVSIICATVSCLLKAVCEVTAVVFGNALIVLIEGYISTGIIVAVLTGLKISALSVY